MPTIRTLLNILIPANEAYRNGSPVMTDADYDAMEDELRAILDVCDEDDTDPDVVEARKFLLSVGAPPPSDGKWAKVTHAVKMTSLNKAQDAVSFDSWVKILGPVALLVVSDKCDGISVNLTYVDGKLVLAATRGDGDVGEDITRNVLKMRGIQPFIKGFSGHVRGEIVLRKSDWKAHFPTYSNCRNAAAGIAKREDGVGVEHLTVLHYQVIRNDAVISRKTIEFQLLERLGCAVPAWAAVATVAEVKARYDAYINGDREALDYDIDGLVVECDSIMQMEELGDLGGRPKGAVAYKFPPDTKQTTLRNILWQVGKSGRITPVAEFDTVSLAGVNVERASLSTAARVAELKLWIGCKIVVSRRNDCIPYVEANLEP